jgi:hypothetical protein
MVPVAPVGGAPLSRVSTAQIADLSTATAPMGPTGPAGLGQISLTSPNGTIAVGGSPGSVLTVVAGTKLLGAENVLPGTYLYANLPAASTYPNMYAATRDQGAVFSNGSTWQILYNAVTGTLRIATGTPLAPATQNTAYSLQLTSTQGIGTVTWILVADIANTNTWAVSSTGLLTGTPTAIETDLLVIQATDSTGSVAQKFVTVATVASQTPAATPTFSPSAGTYVSAQTVTISDTTPSATIYYTTNGSTPSTSSPVYSGPFLVSSTATVQAIATAPGFTQSAVGSATYTITPPANTPTFSPVAGTYTSSQSVAISTTTPSATIYYTTNGTTPTTGSPVYTSPISVSVSETVKAICTAAGYSQSAVGSAAYTIAPAAATPTFSPVGGTYATAQTVTISTTTPSPTIYYTTDGTTPTTGSPVYTAPITVGSSETVQAIATASGYSQSAVGSATYTIAPAAAFTYYIGPRAGIDTNPDGVPAGIDTNPGTLAAPWAITSFRCGSFGTSPNFTNHINGKGVTIGILPGVYDVSALAVADSLSGMIQIPGGNSTNINYVASCNAAGVYSPRTATIDGRGASHNNGDGMTYPNEPPIISHVGVGEGSVAYTLGYLTLDGLRVTGWAYKGMRIGAASYGGPATITHPVVIQNCEFFYGGLTQAGGIMTFTLTAGGSGYLPASGTQTYYNVPLTGGSGTLATADITVTNGVVTAVGAQSAAQNVANMGQGYAVNNTLSASNANLGGSGSGFSITVNSVTSSAIQTDNSTPLWLDGSTNAVTATNNWIHDAWPHTAGNGDHYAAIQCWGDTTNTGMVISNNTIVRAGSIYGKEGQIFGTTLTNNYIDVTNLTASISESCGIQDFTGTVSSTTYPGENYTTVIANNIILIHASDSFDSLGGYTTDLANQYGWNTPVQIYNNTVINNGPNGAIVGQLMANSGTTGVGALKFWNNIYANPGGGSGGFPGSGTNGNFCTTPASLALMDYNLRPSSGVTWGLSGNSNPFSITSYSTLSAWTAAIVSGGGISGVEAHALTGTPTFVATGTLAAYYQLASGSLGKGTGSTTGLSSGAACDMGAWGGPVVPTQIGCNFATNV